MDYRTIVVAIIKNQAGKYLICKKPANQGVYAGQWALPGGGIEPGETMYQALDREVWEEVGLKITNPQPFYFRDDMAAKVKPDGTSFDVYMIYLLFVCETVGETPHFHDDEFIEYAWVSLDEASSYDLNDPTKLTFTKLTNHQSLLYD